MVTTTTTERVWDGEPPPLPAHAVIVAPHPDDEVIGTAGLLVHLRELQVPVTVVAVTDGEASHAHSDRITPDELRERRAAERIAALGVLGVEVDLVRLRLPDAAVRDHGERLARALRPLADRSTTLIAPWRHDGHPDHEAVSAAASAVCRATGARLWEVPIWAKVHAARAGGRPPGRSALILSAAMRQQKAAAVECFASQIVPLGSDAADGPVVHPAELDAMLNGREELLWT